MKYIGLNCSDLICWVQKPKWSEIPSCVPFLGLKLFGLGAPWVQHPTFFFCHIVAQTLKDLKEHKPPDLVGLSEKMPFVNYIFKNPLIFRLWNFRDECNHKYHQKITSSTDGIYWVTWDPFPAHVVCIVMLGWVKIKKVSFHCWVWNNWPSIIT